MTVCSDLSLVPFENFGGRFLDPDCDFLGITMVVATAESNSEENRERARIKARVEWAG